jgi:integrase
MKMKTGYVYREGSRWVARVTFTDESGKRRNIKRYCANKTEATLKKRRLIRELEDRGEKSIEGDKMRFRDLAKRYAETKIVAATYVGDRKVAGLRSLVGPTLYLKVLVDYFGNKRCRSITHADIEAFKLARIKTPTKSKKQRTIAAVNRELELLRAVLNFARRQGWISINPFAQGESLIDRAAENSRERVLTFEEELRLLSVCVGRLAHLRPIIITALDTGMRRGELFQLEWRDVNFDTGILRLRAITTKDNRTREVAMTSRVRAEFQKIWERSPGDMNATVFGIKNVKHSFASACRLAGITDLRFHDFRHTFVTRVTTCGLQERGHETLRTCDPGDAQSLFKRQCGNRKTGRRGARPISG